MAEYAARTKVPAQREGRSAPSGGAGPPLILQNWDELPLVTCNRCACDFVILDMPQYSHLKRFRCHCKRVYWIPRTREFKYTGTHFGPQCMTPEDLKAWKEGR